MNKKSALIDLTPKALVAFTLPQLGLMLCHLAVSMTDIWAAGRIDYTSQAAIGIVGQIFAFLILIVSVAGGGALAAVSQSLGAQKRLKASRYAALTISMAFIVGALTSVIFIFVSPFILNSITFSDGVKAPLEVFALAYGLQLPFFYTLIIMNTIFRAYTFAWIPFVTTLIVAGGNAAGDLLFGLGWFGFPEFGYSGIAWSTFFSTLAGFLFNIFMITRVKILTRESFAPFRWVKHALPYLFKVSVPLSIGQLAGNLGSIVNLALIMGLPDEGAAAVAGMAVGMRIEMVALMPIGAFAVTMTIISGHLLGGARGAELYSVGKKFSFAAAVISGCAALLIFFGRGYVVPFFSHDAEALHQAGVYLFFACAALPFRGYSAVAAAVFAGTGAAKLSCGVTLLSIWCVQVPCSYLLAYRADFGAAGIFAAMAVSGIVSSIMYIMLYRIRQWMSYGMRRVPSVAIKKQGATI